MGTVFSQSFSCLAFSSRNCSSFSRLNGPVGSFDVWSRQRCDGGSSEFWGTQIVVVVVVVVVVRVAVVVVVVNK
ncbi:hypothetical protein ElyMa_005320500 [Elysia marginata]|uniref:SRCR domain-containing protein n=1 Tax=Elysia marginata TaxID=1093978 RepID=A0AAV4K1U1_9GAST|nr:hypothetical protein ElyMa_005320500 [Elysia marginata]